MLPALFRQFLQRLAGGAVHGPVGQRLSTERFVEVNARGVPIQARPLEPAVSVLHGNFGERLQQALAVALAAVFRQDEEILQINARAAKERREVVEEQRISHFFAVLQGEDDLGFAFIENPLFQRVLVGLHGVGQILVFRQFLDETEQ